MASLLSILEEFNLNEFGGEFIKGTDKNTEHSYIEHFYEKAFATTYQNATNQILEIGIGCGAATVLWSKYFTKSFITSVDISFAKLHKDFVDLPNVTRILGDAYSTEISNSLGNFDIIIEDGPHSIVSQLICLDTYLPKLNSGGILIVEDVARIEFITFLKKHVPPDMTTEVVDLRSIKGRHDDILFVCRKP